MQEETGNGTVTGNWFWQLIVGGLGASDHIFHITDWQDNNGTWHVYDPSSVQIPQIPMAQVYAEGGSTSAVFYGIGQNDNHVYVLAADNDGTWSGGYDETPPGVPVLSSNSTSVKSGSPFTISWSVPAGGTVNHYRLGTSLNGTAATYTTIAASTTSQSYTKSAGSGNTQVFDFTVRACSSTDESICSNWSNTVEVDVNGPGTGGGGCPHCRPE